MGISVTKAGPYFGSGEIKFSQLRSNFKETGSGSISASELFRNTNIYDREPITPDSTENDQIASDPFPVSVTWSTTYGPAYVAGQNYVEAMPYSTDYPRGSFDYYFGGVKVGTLDLETATQTYIELGDVRYDSHTQQPAEWTVIDPMSHISGQNYVELTTPTQQFPAGTFKYYWDSVLQGTLNIQGATVDYVEVTNQYGSFRFKGGTLQADGTYSIERSKLTQNFYSISKIERTIGTGGSGPFSYSGVGKNLKASQFRNSIKRYTANQSGNDQFLDMGLKSGSGGIDWDGTNNLDASGVGGNYQRNVQKIINITGIAYSDDEGTNGSVGGGGRGHTKKAAAKLVMPDPLKALNTRLHVSGGIYGAGGKGGFFGASHTPQDEGDPGKDGGPALSISHGGIESITYIHIEGGKIYGGGGGGEQGIQGEWPVAAGLCDLGGYTSCSGGGTVCTTGGGYVAGYDEGCHGSGGGGSCGPGEISASLHIATLPCPDGSGYGTISAVYCYTQTCTTTPRTCSYTSYGSYTSTLPIQGRGGQGGNGAAGVPGSPNYQAQSSGSAGTQDIDAKCNSGGTLGGAKNSSPGGTGEDGGQHGSPGGSNAGKSPAASGLAQGEGGGKGGAAVCGKYFKTPLLGNTGSSFIRGTIGNQCDGTNSPPIIVPNLPTVTMGDINYIRFVRPQWEGTFTQTLNVTGTVSAMFAHKWNDKSDFGYGMQGLKIYKPDGSLLWSSVRNIDFPTPGSSELPKIFYSPQLTITEGIYPVEFVELHANNKGGTDSNGNDYLRDDRLLEMGQKMIFYDGDGNDRNQEVYILPNGTETIWRKSYVTGTHGSASDANDWATDFSSEYVGMNQYWSAFMRRLAYWENNSDPKTQAGAEPSFFQAWSFNPPFNSTKDDGSNRPYYLRAQSDNDCKFFINQTFEFAETTKYDSSGVNVLNPVINYEFVNGTNVSIRVQCFNRQPLSISWDTINAPGYVAGQNYVLFTTATTQYPRGTFEYYWGGVKVGTLNIEGASVTYIETEDGNYRYDSHTQVDPNQNFYTISRIKRSPQINWKENPAGVAFEVYTHDDAGNEVLVVDSSPAGSEGTVWGAAQISYSVTNVNLADPLHNVDGFSNPVDPSYNIPRALSSDGYQVIGQPTRATTYSVRAKNGGGSVTASKQVK